MCRGSLVLSIKCKYSSIIKSSDVNKCIFFFLGCWAKADLVVNLSLLSGFVDFLLVLRTSSCHTFTYRFVCFKSFTTWCVMQIYLVGKAMMLNELRSYHQFYYRCIQRYAGWLTGCNIKLQWMIWDFMINFSMLWNTSYPNDHFTPLCVSNIRLMILLLNWYSAGRWKLLLR